MQATASHAIAKFPTLVKFRAPVGFQEALSAAARRNHTSASEWARQVLLREMRREGLRLRNGSVEDLKSEGSA
jgi:hypothetical protein